MLFTGHRPASSARTQTPPAAPAIARRAVSRDSLLLAKRAEYLLWATLALERGHTLSRARRRSLATGNGTALSGDELQGNRRHPHVIQLLCHQASLRFPFMDLHAWQTVAAVRVAVGRA